MLHIITLQKRSPDASVRNRSIHKIMDHTV